MWSNHTATPAEEKMALAVQSEATTGFLLLVKQLMAEKIVKYMGYSIFFVATSEVSGLAFLTTRLI